MRTKYTFWKLLNEYKIEIPKIQRDYAQGRENVEVVKIVDKFLEEIKKSILTNRELNLDFIYGKVDDEILIPLDGQQRLTTLFLIHWYITIKENHLNNDVKTLLSKFTYETRVSSEDFCSNIVLKGIDYNSINGSISNVITDSKWYFLSWELDPTVLAMLNMLDKIHNKFHDIEAPIFDKLINGNNITFHFLPLEKFKLTDELYIKMNARGKPLTEFENFKANFSQYLNTIEEKSKLDNEWLDIFWSMGKSDNSEIITKNVDEKFFNFFKNITLNFYIEENDIDRDFLNNYSLFTTYSKVFSNAKYVNHIIKILDSLVSFDNKDEIFKSFLSSSVNYWERLHFYSLSQFFIKYGELLDENQLLLSRWLRVTKNLINNTRIEGPKEFESALRSINQLSENIDDVYTYISSSSDSVKFFSKLQRAEESLKAKLILDNPDWETLFIQIENHTYFDGQIGFILNYSKTDSGDYDRALFQNYSQKLSLLFSNDFQESQDFLFQRALLTKGDYLVSIGQNRTFCLFDEALRTKLDNWRKVFNDNEKSLMLKRLLDDINVDSMKSDLSEVIRNHSVSDWRRLIIEHPDNIEYCKYRELRKYSDDKIYLLSKGQMNGRHKELFSWDLFKRKFKDVKFTPFSKEPWYWQSTSWDEPCIVLEGYVYKENRFAIDIYYESEGKYCMTFYEWNDAEIPNQIEKIFNDLGFVSNKLIIPENLIEEKLKEVTNKLDNME